MTLLREFKQAMPTFGEVWKACFNYIPTAHGTTPRGGATLTQPGGTSQEKYEALCKLKAEIKRRKEV